MYSCPDECGSREFLQTAEQTESVHVNEDGEPTAFDEVGDPIMLELECEKCGAEVPADD